MNSKLILFDIDGTLTYHVGVRPWNEQYEHGMKVAYGITKKHAYHAYNGVTELHMAWDIVQKHGINREDFFAKFPAYVIAMQEHLLEWEKKGPVFQAIPEGKELVNRLLAQKKHIMGLLTGNAKRIGLWKLSHTGFDPRTFTFGLFGEEADDRISLAKLVFEKAEKELGRKFSPGDIVVVGDTIHDIRCGKAIGATVIAVTTGMHGDKATLAAEKPDLLVDSLLDPAVLSLFSLP